MQSTKDKVLCSVDVTPTTTVNVVFGNIAQQRACAIVNAANAFLTEGGGVCGAIYQAAGSRTIRGNMQQVLRESNRTTPVPTSSVTITHAGMLRPTVHWIIHAVGPVYDQYLTEDAARLLESTVWNVLDAAEQQGCEHVAMPFISAGIYGFPAQACAKIHVEMIRTYVSRYTRLRTITLMDFKPFATTPTTPVLEFARSFLS